MRQLLASLLGGGGLLATLAFFLPWAAVSCDGAPLATASPHDRAAGIEAVRAERAGIEVESPAIPPEAAYWWLLVPAVCSALAGLGIHVARHAVSLRLAAAGGVSAAVGAYTTVQVGLIDHIGIDALAVGELLVGDITVTTEPGVWLSLAGYVLALSGATASVVLASRLDDY